MAVNIQIASMTLAAVSVFGVFLAVAWPWLVPNDVARRLREHLSGDPIARAKRREAVVVKENKSTSSLQTKPSELLSRLIAIFRVSERLNDGKMVQMLQQAGYRGRPAAAKYLTLRIFSPLLFLGGSGAYAMLFLGGQTIAMKIGAVVAATVLGFFLPKIMLKNRIDKRKLEIGRAWPDAVDLMLICVETGMSIEHALKKVADEMGSTSIELAKEMSLTTAELSYLQERRQAFENLSRRTDLETVQAVAGCLIQSEKYGTSLGVSLRVLAQESRKMRMAAAEKKAAALPPKLTVPMIIFFLPVLFAVIITPAAIQIMAT